MKRSDQVKVVYVSGSGRSGSTLFDLMLGSHPEIASFEELRRLPSDGWIKNQFDSSGKRCSEVPFWNDVKLKWQAKSPKNDINRFAQRIEEFEKLRNWPKHYLDTQMKNPLFKEYLAFNKDLLLALAEASGVKTIVDSSKHPMRACYLSLIPELDVKFIHLTRDPRGVSQSYKLKVTPNPEEGIFHSTTGQSTFISMKNWLTVNFASKIVSRRFSNAHRMLLRFEDLMSDTVKTMNFIGNVIEIDLSNLAHDLANGKKINPEHVIAGNRLRLQKDIEIKYKESWPTKLSKAEQLFCTGLSRLLLPEFGY